VIRLKLQILLQQHPHLWPKGHEPALVELGILDNQQSPTELHILNTKPANLTHPEAQAVEDRKYGVVGYTTV